MFDLSALLRFWLPDARRMTASDSSTGFSGALIYRVETPQGQFCLRCWPTGDAGLPPARIAELHRWLTWLRDCGISTIAVPERGLDGSTIIAWDSRIWQLEPWLPGTADFHAQPTDLRLRNIGTELARLHLASERYQSTSAGHAWFECRHGTSPAVSERIARLQRLTVRGQSNASAPIGPSWSAQLDLANMLQGMLPPLAVLIKAELEAFLHTDLRLHPCLRDIWHDHILLTGDVVTGIVDPSAARVENVASDLSRLLGSLLGDDFARWATALEDYSRVRALSNDERQLVRVLDRSGVVLSAAHWLERIPVVLLTEQELARVQMLAARVTALQ